MKFLVIAALAISFLSGCLEDKPNDIGFFGAHPSEDSTVPPLEEGPRFRFGDPVFVDVGFYKGCQGNVTEFERELRGYVYTVNAKCSSVNGKYVETKIVKANERDLIADETRN